MNAKGIDNVNSKRSRVAQAQVVPRGLRRVDIVKGENGKLKSENGKLKGSSARSVIKFAVERAKAKFATSIAFNYLDIST